MTIKDKFWKEGNILVTRGNKDGQFQLHYKVKDSDTAIACNLFDGSELDSKDYDDNLKLKVNKSYDIVEVYVKKELV